MYLATGLVIVYLLFVVSLRAVAPPNRQLLGHMAIAVAATSTAVLASTYFVDHLSKAHLAEACLWLRVGNSQKLPVAAPPGEGEQGRPFHTH